MFDDPRLSDTVRGIVADPGHEIRVSSASAWEISTKFRLSRLPSAAPLMWDISGWIARAGFTELPVSISHANRAGSWPQDHRDPFDRMLAAQSAVEELPLISRDPAFAAFAIRTLW